MARRLLKDHYEASDSKYDECYYYQYYIYGTKFYLFRGILKLYRNGSTASDDELGSNGITRTAADDILSSRVDFSGGSDFPDHVGVQPAWRWAS